MKSTDSYTHYLLGALSRRSICKEYHMFSKIVILLTLLLSFGHAKNALFQSVPPQKATLLQQGSIKPFCIRCGMMLTKFYKTNHAIRFTDGTTEQYCSMHCLVDRLAHTDPKKISKILVVDLPSLSFVDARTAWYVVGSNLPGTMTTDSKYAFAKRAEAEAFAKKHGGKVVDFDQALQIARQEFGRDLHMIETKRSHMAKIGAKIAASLCDEEALKKLSFEGIGELKARILEHKLCTPLKPKQLQAVAIYLASIHGAHGHHRTFHVPKSAKCPVCGMFVSKYPKWAAALTYEDGRTLYFDGVKDMMKYYLDPAKFHATATKPSTMTVQDFYTLRPIDATKAWYVIGSNVVGPMGRELIPFATKADAELFAQEHFGKKIVSFDQITEETVHRLDQ